MMISKGVSNRVAKIMKSYFTSFARKLEHFCIIFSRQTFRVLESFLGLVQSCFNYLLFRGNPFWIQVFYFITMSFLGYLSLKLSKPKSSTSLSSKDFDVFFTSVSAATVASMSTLEMEIFSNIQQIIITILMFLGGEVFISLLGLQFQELKSPKQNSSNSVDQIELGLVNSEKPNSNLDTGSFNNDTSIKYDSMRCLGYVVLGYLLVAHVVGSFSVFLYVSVIESARELLSNRGIQGLTFSVFTIVSTFANCGFVPTNENMIVFNRNSGLLLLLIPQIFLGGALYPSCLRFLIWVLEKTTKRREYSYILKNSGGETGYSHLFSTVHCSFLAVTVFGFVFVQFVLFCILEWQSEAMAGLNGYQKLVGALFQTVNSRHTGESVVDLSSISSAILVLFIVMMYLPPYTSFLPTKQQEDLKKCQRRGFMENILFSQLSYLVIFIILICIAERDKMENDPLNFNVLNITLEVVSAYGSVGFSTGYSCKRQLKPDGTCKDAWYGFAGRWSYKGKFILICVMFFGRLKKFNITGGQGWVLM